MTFYIEPFSLLWFIAGIVTSWALLFVMMFAVALKAGMGQKKP